MPEIAVSATPVAVANATPAAGNSNTAAADGQSAGPFAAVLQQQMAAPAATSPAAIKAAAIATTDAVPAAENLAALLPMLMGSAMLASTVPAEAGGQATAKTGAREEDAGGIGTTPLLLALPTTTTQTNTMLPANATTPPGGASTATTAATTANLAATPDPAVAEPTQRVQSKDGFDALLADNRNVRPLGLPNDAIHTASAANTNISHNVDTPVGNHGWDAEVGNRLVWMSDNHASHADLVLTPPQMGKIEISLTMSGDQATATFTAANPAVREAIENAIPRLREILADAGVTLGQTQVGSDAPGQSANGRENGDNSFGSSAVALGSTSGLAPATGTGSWTGAGRGLVDVFA
jgi:flagellar hook-length control protein FliK